jgi:hypothetical protein
MLLSLLVVLAATPVFLNAKIFSKTGTTAMQFLKLGVDARAIGMGEAYTAVTDDISSVYWNPAGLALKTENQAFFSHTNWIAGVMHDYAAVSYTNGVSALAFSTSLLHMDGMKVTDEPTFDYTGELFYAYDLSAGITYSSAFTDKFSFGVTGKYLRESLDENAINTFSVDLGSIYNTGWRNLKIGMSLRNFGPDVSYKMDNDGDNQTDEDPFDLIDNDGDGQIDEDGSEISAKIPMNFSLGTSMDLYRTDTQYLIVSGQLDNTIDRQETWNVGMEYKWNNFYIRGGRQFNMDTNGFAGGLGWQIATRLAVFNIDWSYTQMGYLEEDFLHSAHRLSLKMQF